MAKIQIFPLCIGYSCTTLWVKNSLEIALSLTVCEIFVIFHIFTKSSNKVPITHLYIEQQLWNLNMLQFTKKVDEQHIWEKLCSCNTFEDISHLLIMVIIKNSIRDARTPQPREIFLTPWDIEVLYQYKVQDTFRALSVIYRSEQCLNRENNV